ncbi:radical SAM protein [Myxococcota bacterium]|nr:radical SAM protein [Myxococcota bacterium]MBU1537529.1 radical SAM protein [Myxococcota bacterium]
MRVIYENGETDLATVYVGLCDDGSRIEFVESVQPPIPQREKWVLIISTLKGCPVKCPMCDAGGDYRGILSTKELFDQLDHLILGQYPTGSVPVKKLKVQFARMGDPAFNDNVLEVLSTFSSRYDAPGFLPSISTVAPSGRNPWFESLLHIKSSLPPGRFQLQFSLHTTDYEARKTLIPIKTMSFREMAQYGETFYESQDQKVTLNFANPEGFPMEPSALLPLFDPRVFLIKLTPVNPTVQSTHNHIRGRIDAESRSANDPLVNSFRDAGYDVILSIGEQRENIIGSNCGMYVEKLAGSQITDRLPVRG